MREKRMENEKKKKSISFDYDQARFRPVRVSFKQFSVQNRLL